MFADPPYGGEGIQYAELSALWCAWLEPAAGSGPRAEIGVNPVQGRRWEDYAAGLAAAFAAVREAIEPGRRADGDLREPRGAGLARARGRPGGGALRVEADERRPRSAPA